MKKFLKFCIVSMVSFMLSICVGILVMLLTWSVNAAVSVTFGGFILISLSLGAFDMNGRKEPTNYGSIRHRDGRRYNQAAIFIGTACVFMGTPQQCSDVCDDLWHMGQQARVELLSGNESFDVL